MVATLGIVNVSADDSDPGIPSYGDSKILVTRSTNLTYDGQEQTVFTLKCVNRDDKDANGIQATCHYKYAVSTEKDPRNDSNANKLNWSTSTSEDKEKNIEVKAKDAGTYYLHLAMFKNDGETISQYNVYGYDKNTQTSSMTVEIAKANAPTVNITAPFNGFA